MEIGNIGSEQVKALAELNKIKQSNTAKKKDKTKSSSGITGLFKYTPKKKTKKKKKLSYNFKKISNQILSSKNSVNASKALTKARTTVIMLVIQQRSSDYDEKELKDALEHAEEMVRVAKKRKKHMEQEERLTQGSETVFSEEFEENAETEESSNVEDMEDGEYDGELSAEEMQEVAREIEEMTRESMEESLMELADDLLSASYGDLSDEEIEELKRKHRAEELRDIMEADMKYLKALFERLQKEKQQSSSSRSSASEASDAAASAVSLEIAGVDVPVQAEAAATVVEEGQAVDVSV